MINIPAILVANISGVIILFLLLFNLYRKEHYTFLDGKLYCIMAYLNIIQCIIESAALILDGKIFTGAIFLSYLLNTIIFINVSAFAFIWVVYLYYKLNVPLSTIKSHCKILIYPFFINVFLSLLNLFTPLLFTITKDNVYERGPVFFIAFAVAIFYIAYSCFLVFHYKKSSGKYISLPIILFLIPVMTGSITQMLNYGLSLLWLGCAIGLTSLYVNLQNEISFTDSLSSLFTRQYINQYFLTYIKKYKGKVAGFMLDINNFKSINDTYGHLEGDEAIGIIGKIIHDSIPQNALGARFAGDEFIVLCPYQKMEEIPTLMEKLNNNTKSFNDSSSKPYKLQYAIGCAIYKETIKSLDELLREMDDAMYKNKNKSKQSSLLK